MSGESVKLKILRFDSEVDEAPVYVDYEVPWREGMLVLTALNYVRENIDETLAFRDFCCGCAWCTSCLMMVNGKGALTCARLIKPGESLIIEPMRGNPVIKDLVVDFGVTKTTEQGAFKISEGTVIQKM